MIAQAKTRLRRLLPKNAFARGVSVLVGGTAGAQLLTAHGGSGAAVVPAHRRCARLAAATSSSKSSPTCSPRKASSTAWPSPAATWGARHPWLKNLSPNMQIEAIYDQGRIELAQPLQLRHPHLLLPESFRDHGLSHPPRTLSAVIPSGVHRTHPGPTTPRLSAVPGIQQSHSRRGIPAGRVVRRGLRPTQGRAPVSHYGKISKKMQNVAIDVCSSLNPPVILRSLRAPPPVPSRPAGRVRPMLTLTRQGGSVSAG